MLQARKESALNSVALNPHSALSEGLQAVNNMRQDRQNKLVEECHVDSKFPLLRSSVLSHLPQSVLGIA